MLALGCRINGRVAVWQTMGYGPSPAVYLVNNLVNLAVLDAALKHEVFAEAFIDDVFIAGNKPEIRRDLEKLGLQFSNSKSQQGKIVDYCGTRINATNRTVEILPKTYTKLKHIRDECVFTNLAGESAMEFDKLQEFSGVVVHASRTSSFGLSKAFHILGKLAVGINDSENMVALGKEDLKEINWWCDEKHVMPMKSLKTSGTTIKIFDSNPYKKQKLGANSDASTKWWGCKVNGKAYCGEFPPELVGEPIQVLEMYGLSKVVQYMENEQKMIVSVDNTNTHFSFQKRRSKNAQMNKLLIEIAEDLIKNRKVVITRWIPTLEMASRKGSDALSRMNLDESFDPNTLNQDGAALIKKQFGKISVDLFSGPKNNVFDCRYCSTYYVMTDKNNMQEDGLSFMTGRELRGRFWCWSPCDLVIPVLDILTGIDWKNKNDELQIMFMVKERNVKNVIAALWNLKKSVKIYWSQFYKAGNNPKYLHQKGKSSLILFIIGSCADKYC